MFLDRFSVQNAVIRKRFFLKVLQNQVVFIGKFQDQTMFLTVSRNTGNSIRKSFLRTLIEYVLTKYSNLAGFCLTKTCQDFYKLCLSVSIYAGKTYDLTSADIQVESLEDLYASVILGMQIIDLQNDFAWFHVFLVNFEVDITTYHHGCQIILVYI